MTDPYRIRPAETWVQARDDYLSGLNAETVCRRHDLGLSAFRRRARKFGWRRSDQVELPPDETDLSLYADFGLDEQVRTARLRFVQALDIGRATEARRWRNLWLELREASDAFEDAFWQGMSPDEIEAFRAAMTTQESEADAEEEALLTPSLPPGP